MKYIEAYLLFDSGQRYEIVSFDFSKSTNATPDVGVVQIMSELPLELTDWDSEQGVNQPIKSRGGAGISVGGDSGFAETGSYFDAGGVGKLKTPERDLASFTTRVIERPDEEPQKLIYKCKFIAEQKKVEIEGNQPRIEIDYLYITKGGLVLEKESQPSGNKIYSVQLADERFLWHERGVVGAYRAGDKYYSNSFNVQSDYGIPVPNGEGLYRENTLNEGKLFNIYEIFDRLIYFLPNHRGKRYELVWNTSLDKKEIPININNVGGAKAIDIINSMARDYGVMFTYVAEDKVAIVNRGARFSSIGKYRNSQFIDSLPSVRSVFHEKSLPEWLPINYRVSSNKENIYDAYSEQFVPVVQHPETNEWLTLAEAAKIIGLGDKEIRTQALIGLGGTGFEIEKIPDEWRRTLQRNAYKSFAIVDAKLPMTRDRLLPHADTKELTRVPTKITTSIVVPSPEKDPMGEGFWLTYTGVIPNDMYKVDTQNGVITFNTLVGSVGSFWKGVEPEPAPPPVAPIPDEAPEAGADADTKSFEDTKDSESEYPIFAPFGLQLKVLRWGKKIIDNIFKKEE